MHGGPALILRERFARQAADDGYDASWMSDDDDTDDEDAASAWYEREATKAVAHSNPPSGVRQINWDGYKVSVVQKGFSATAAPRPPMPIGRGVPASTTPMTAVLEAVEHPNTRCVNIRQPWATLIGIGLKDVENRSTILPHNSVAEDFCWVAVVASAHDAKKDLRQWGVDMRDVERCVFWNGGYDAPDLPPVRHDKAGYPSQAVVAFARMRCSSPLERGSPWTGKHSIWNHGDKYCWEVLETHLLEPPVWFGTGNQTPATFLTPPRKTTTADRANAMAHIRTEIKKRLSSSLARESPRNQASMPPPQTPRPQTPPAQMPPAQTPPQQTPAVAAMFAALDRIGCATLSVGQVVDTAHFLETLDVGTHHWFFERLHATMALPIDSTSTPAQQKAWRTVYAAQQSTWHTVYTEAQRAAVCRLYNPSTSTGLMRIFDSDQRLGSAPVDIRDFFAHCVAYVKMGDSNMGLANMHKSWSNKGFGKWARINPGIGWDIMAHVVHTLRLHGIAEATFEDQLPHIIYKPPNGTKLECHHDSIQPLELRKLLREHVDESDPSMVAWVRKHGLQTLCHVEGGVTDGYTFMMGPMTPRKLLICIEALCANEISGAFKDSADHKSWRDAKAGTGPYFAKWSSPVVLKALNRRLHDHGEDPIREIPIRPSSGTPVGVYVAMWPVGIPHGSSTNRTRRVTITLPISIGGSVLHASSRSVRRLKAMATVAAPDADLETPTLSFYGGTPPDQRRKAEAQIRNDTEPLADGPTHIRPEYALEYIRHPDDAGVHGAPGHYTPLAPTLRQARDFFATAGVAM